MYPAEGYDNSEGADYNKSGGIRKWTLPCVFIRYISHRFSGFYKTCMGTLIWSVLWKISCLHDIFQSAYWQAILLLKYYREKIVFSWQTNMTFFSLLHPFLWLKLHRVKIFTLHESWHPFSITFFQWLSKELIFQDCFGFVSLYLET